MRKFFIILFLVVYSSVFAQSLEERYRSFEKSAVQNYADFRDKANETYVKFLQSSWTYYAQKPAIGVPSEQPVTPTPYVAKDANKESQELQYNGVICLSNPAQPSPLSPVVENKESSVIFRIAYCGMDLAFRHPRVDRVILTNLSGEQISRAWLSLSGEAYDNLLFDCLTIRDQHHLCDWAYIQMLQQLSEKIYGESNEAVLLQAFLYAQSGYAMRLAKSETKLYLLIGTNYQLYNRKYFELGGLFYYPLTDAGEGLTICSGSFENESPMTISLGSDQIFGSNNVTTIVRKSKSGIETTITINLDAITFYNSYPTGMIGGDCGSRWETYANAPMEECVKQSLYPSLRNAIRGLSEAQAVAKLLDWVQTAFEYDTDEHVWGTDRAFFPSESLYYPHNDCEDRAILFSRIVRDLLGLDVVLLYYPGHLAAAVCFNQETNGDYIEYNNHKYIVCDPTFIGAPVGATMPGMDNKTAKIIALRK